jgi:flagellar biosynthesis GTPase FlhF
MKRILLSSLLALGLIVSIAPPALAADTQPPILLDWKLIDEKVDISSGDATARVEFSISDDSEIDSWVIVLLGSRTSTQASGLVFSKLTSKVGKISTYQATATIGFGKAPGEWSWTLYPLKDVLGNDSSRFGPGGAWPVTIMVFDKDFTEAKYLADLKAAEEKATAELKAKQEADEKAAADKAAADKAAADKAAAELKAKQEAEAKAAADKAAAELKAKQEAEATSTRLKSELTSEANKLLVLIEKLLKTATAGASKNELITLKSTLNTLTLEFNRGILFEGALLNMYKNDLIGLNLKYSKIYSALNKKTTITCIKGKLTKKVIAVKPVCPKGYKKK